MYFQNGQCHFFRCLLEIENPFGYAISFGLCKSMLAEAIDGEMLPKTSENFPPLATTCLTRAKSSQNADGQELVRLVE